MRIKWRRPLVRVLQKYAVWWYIATALLYGMMIPLTVLVFPATTLLVTVVVLFSGFTASMASLASVLSDAEGDDAPEA
jgi:hypothetical protein